METIAFYLCECFQVMNQTWGQKASLLLRFLYKLYNAPNALAIYIYNRLCPWKFISPKVLDARILNLVHNMFFIPYMLKVNFNHVKFNYMTFRFEWWYDGVD